MVSRYIGKAVRRVEDLRLITGNGRFTDALDIEGVVAIYTYEDLEGPAAEPLPVLIPHPNLHAPRTGYALAKNTVNHVGEPIVMVVAENRYLAEDAAARIGVE